jgi:hypothetical protein
MPFCYQQDLTKARILNQSTPPGVSSADPDTLQTHLAFQSAFLPGNKWR